MEPRQLEFKTSPGSVCNFVCFFVGSVLQTNRAFKKPLFLSFSTYIKKSSRCLIFFLGNMKNIWFIDIGYWPEVTGILAEVFFEEGAPF